MSDELKPCPFCGGAMQRWIEVEDSGPAGAWTARVTCAECDADGPPTKDWHERQAIAEEGAIAAWNTRALEAVGTPAKVPADAVERLKSMKRLLIESNQPFFVETVNEILEALNRSDAPAPAETPEDCSERERNVVQCDDCGKAHDRRIRCPNFHANMMPTPAPATDKDDAPSA